jgi:hypothetical protein
MGYKLLLVIVAIAASTLNVQAQVNDVPDYKLANELQAVTGKIGLPVDSALVYIKDFKKVEGTVPSEIVLKSRLDDDVSITFKMDENDHILVILSAMPVSFLSTVKKYISSMGMIRSDTEAPPGYTAYATPKYAAFLNPQIKAGFLSLVMMQGGK